jgi:WD40 repeat protein
MNAPRLVLCLAVLGGLSFGRLSAGEPRPRTDTFGDVLPDRAFARLGTTRLQLGDSPSSLAYSPDGKLFAAGCSYEGRIVVWSMPSGRKLHEFQVGKNHPAWSVFSGDGASFACLSGVKSLLWDMKTGKELPVAEGAEGLFGTPAFAPDSKSIAGTTRSGDLRLWSLPDGKEIRVLKGVKGRIWALAFPGREKLLALARDGETLAVWDALRGQRLHEPVDAGTTIRQFALSPDGKHFAFETRSRIISVRSVADGKERYRLDGPTQDIYDLSFSADGGSLAVSSRDTTVRVWDVATGKERSKCETTPGGLPIVALSPDGKTLATGGPNHPHAVLFWDTATGRRRNDFPGHTGPIYSLAFSPDGKQVATASWLRGDSEVRLWDAGSGRLLREITAHDGGVAAVAFSPDGKRLATGGWWNGQKVKIWNPETGKELQTFTGHAAGVTHLAFSSDGKRLASGDAYYNDMGEHEGRVHVWDLVARKQLTVLSGHKGAVQGVEFDLDGATVFVAANGFYGYDLASGAQIGEPLHPRDRVECFAFSPDRKILLTVTARASGPQLTELATGQSILDLKVGACGLAALSPDGRFLALGIENEVRLFDRANGEKCLTLRGIHGVVATLAFSPNGRVLTAAGTEDTSALLWDVADLSKRPLPSAKKADAATLDRWWASLKEADAAEADRAGWALVGNPEQTVARAKASLQPVAAADAKRLAKLVADLDSDQFETRERASQDLETLGETAGDALREALRNKPSAEQWRRIEDLLARLKGKPIGGEWLRATRAVAVLERIGTPEARDVLKMLAGGAPGALLTRDAREALKRLDRRK